MSATIANKDRAAQLGFKFHQLQSDARRIHVDYVQIEEVESCGELAACGSAAFDAMFRLVLQAEDLRRPFQKRAGLKPADVQQIAEAAASCALTLREAMHQLAEQVQKLEAAGETARSHVAAGSYGLLELAEIELAALRAEVTA